MKGTMKYNMEKLDRFSALGFIIVWVTIVILLITT
jgi:hypothetical protein|tara:strand:+ start:2594 stop:2698 length:105 start_codon:yes stop_codon:yes gene_type:complete